MIFDVIPTSRLVSPFRPHHLQLTGAQILDQRGNNWDGAWFYIQSLVTFHLNYIFPNNNNDDSPPDLECRLQIILQLKWPSFPIIHPRHEDKQRDDPVCLVIFTPAPALSQLSSPHNKRRIVVPRRSTAKRKMRHSFKTHQTTKLYLWYNLVLNKTCF